MTHTYPLVPYVLAFIAFILRFYGREHAGSKTSLSFILAIVTVLSALAFLFLGVGHLLPSYGDISFLLLGIVLLGVSIARWFML